MDVSIEGVIVLVVFYLCVLMLGILATCCFKAKNQDSTAVETSLVAGRRLKGAVSVFTMMATTVGGGYINGTAESVATAGLVWTLAPFGIFIGLNIGGLVYARRMREKEYITMLDPIQRTFGRPATVLVYLASLWGDLLWTASILSALGTSLSVIARVPLVPAVCMSAGVTMLYTMIGNMVAVAYTDILQLLLIFVGLTVSLPFVLTSEKVASLETSSETWLGHLDVSGAATWVDLLFAMSFGTIPWQAYFQRVLSVSRPSEAVMFSVVGAFGAVIFAVPSVLIGAAGTSADWNATSWGHSPLSANLSEASMVLPLVIKEFTPPAVSVLGLGAISAAVMSSMDSCVLGSSAMFTHNIYHGLFRHKAKDRELMVVQRLAVLFISLATVAISLSVPVIYGLFILAADIVYVIILPQLTYAIFLPRRGSVVGSVAGFVVGVLLRFGAGEPTLGLPPFIPYSEWDPTYGQSFPFRTTAMLCSGATIVIVSEVERILRQYWSDARYTPTSNVETLAVTNLKAEGNNGSQEHEFQAQETALLDKRNSGQTSNAFLT